MKIAMFTDAYWPRVNGVTVSVDSFSRALIKAGHEVLIVCASYPRGAPGPLSTAAAGGEEGGSRIVRVPSMPAFITKEDRLAKLHRWFWVFKQVEAFDPDIIHINTEVVIAEFGFLYARTHNLPALYTFHTMWEDYGPNYFPRFPSKVVKFAIRGVLKNILARSFRVIVPTPQIDEVVHKYRPKTKTFLLPTGIEPELFERNRDEVTAYRERLEGLFPRLKGKRVLLFAGRVVKEKNLGFLLDILPGIIAQHKDVVLLIAGNGPDQKYYSDEAKKRGLEDACVFSGYMERGDLALAYRIAKVFVFPSLTDTQGLVTLEAMLSGTPVVAIGALGTLMVMGGDNGGFMVKNDQAEFSGRVLELLENGELWQRKSEEARKHALPWSIGELAKKLVAIYESTLGDYREARGERYIPVWTQMMDKKWWKAINKVLREKTTRKWQAMMSKLSGRPREAR